MRSKLSYTTNTASINRDNMHLVVVHHRPQYIGKSQEILKQEIEKELFHIFQKYE